MITDILLFFAYIVASAFFLSKGAAVALSAYVVATGYNYSPLFDAGSAWENHFIVSAIYVLFSIICILIFKPKLALALLSFSVLSLCASVDYILFPASNTWFSTSWLFLCIALNLVIIFAVYMDWKNEFRGRKGVAFDHIAGGLDFRYMEKNPIHDKKGRI